MTEAFLVRHYGVPNLHLCREGYEYVVCPACGSHIVLERDFVDQWFEIEGDGWARVDEYDQTRVVLHTQCDWEPCSGWFNFIVFRPNADPRHSEFW